MTVSRSKDDATSIVIVLACLFLPPLGVLLLDGIGPEFIISICLTILGWIPGVIYAVWLWTRAGGLNARTRSEARIERFKRKFQQRRARDEQDDSSASAGSSGHAGVPKTEATAPTTIAPATTAAPAVAAVSAPAPIVPTAAPTTRASTDISRVDGATLQASELTAAQRQPVAPKPTGNTFTMVPRRGDASSPAGPSKSSDLPAVPILGTLLKRRAEKRASAHAQTVPAYPTRQPIDDSFTPISPLEHTEPVTLDPTPAAVGANAAPSTSKAGVVETVREASNESESAPKTVPAATAAPIAGPALPARSQYASSSKVSKHLPAKASSSTEPAAAAAAAGTGTGTAAAVSPSSSSPKQELHAIKEKIKHKVKTVKDKTKPSETSSAPEAATSTGGGGGGGGGGFYRGLFARNKGKARATEAVPTAAPTAAPAADTASPTDEAAEVFASPAASLPDAPAIKVT